ncbi:hypothetical protein [Leptospira noguchii]|uniref:Uncharacterized protein n=1 Tax=Leptospira noguchii TaxID=28182 RepID=A0AAE9KA10_9LEPT|nr:hypothetical protein [Leptospira noguchii]UOG58048.1 hypothetical protein MAL03_08135 [Leptospira noguchii]
MLRSVESHNLTHKLNRILESKLNSVKRSPELSVSLLWSLEVTQRLTPRTQQNAFYESVLGRSTGRV